MRIQLLPKPNTGCAMIKWRIQASYGFLLHAHFQIQWTFDTVVLLNLFGQETTLKTY